MGERQMEQSGELSLEDDPGGCSNWSSEALCACPMAEFEEEWRVKPLLVLAGDGIMLE